MTAPREQGEFGTDLLCKPIHGLPRNVRVILGVEHHHLGAFELLDVMHWIEEHAAP